MTPSQYYAAQAASSGSSFYYSLLFLSRTQRKAMMALYAFYREVSDIINHCHDAEIALTKLNWWREEITRLFNGKAEHPISKTLQATLSKYPLKIEWFQEMLDGMQMDLEWPRYPDFSQLQKYCYRAAGTLGLLSANILGYTEKATLGYAEKLGETLQLIKIIRNVGADATQGRIYIPLTELQQFGVTADDIFQRRYSENFTALMQFQAQRARKTLHEALALLPQIDRRAQKPGLMMAAIYLALLTEIEHEEMRVLHQHISLPPIRKLWLAATAWLRG